jgi:transcriptional regulator with XRE-family HTH domain
MKQTKSDKNDLKILGETIKGFRLAKNLTLNRAAQMAFLNSTQLDEIEKGKRDARMATILRIAKAWEIPIGKFFGPFYAKEGGHKD